MLPYFNISFFCHVRGTSLQAEITIKDDIDPSQTETTGWIDIPDAVTSLPGVLPQQHSYNGTFDVAPDLSQFAFVLKQGPESNGICPPNQARYFIQSITPTYHSARL